MLNAIFTAPRWSDECVLTVLADASILGVKI